MKDIFMDLASNVSSFNFNEIKVIASDEALAFEAVAEDRSVIMKAKSKAPVDGLRGTFGLPSVPMLVGILGLSSMKEDGAEIIVQDKNGEPDQLKFKSNNFGITYRLMSEQALGKQPGFLAPAMDAVTEPTKGAFVTFREHTSVFSKVTTKFKPVVEGDALMIELGSESAANHNDRFKMADVEGTLGGSYEYPVAAVASALALMGRGECTLSFSSKGVAVVKIDTGLLELSFIFPGHS